MTSDATSTITEALQNGVQAGVSADSAEGAHCTGVRHTCPRKAEPAGCRVKGHVVSKLGSQWWLCCY